MTEPGPRPAETETGERPIIERVLTLPADTLVRIRILDALDSGVNRSGDSFRFVVCEPVFHEGRAWIARWARGRGLLNRVRRAGRFGRNGKIDVSFGQVSTTSGRPVMLSISKKASEVNNRDKLAAGASFVGAVALGPIGLAAGALVKGVDAVIEPGSELYVATQEPISW